MRTDGAGADILQGLRSAADGAAWASAPLEFLPDRGLAHWHVRLVGTGMLARIPKQSQVGLPAQENLRHQQACFECAEPSGHTPRLLGVLAPTQALARGALLVEEIRGEPPELPQDLAALARALASLHRVPAPPASLRALLPDPPDPLRDFVAEVSEQARYLTAAPITAPVRECIEAQLANLQADAAERARPPRHLIAFDAHPGNFVVRADGSAVLVDLEKCRYSHAGFDLAHATLYTSTTWDAQASAVLTPHEVAGFYAAWDEGVGKDMATAAHPWHVPLRRAMWLWSVTWCCKWQVLADAPRAATAHGEDWSAEISDEVLVAHVRERVAHYLSEPAVERVQDELRQLPRLLDR